MSPILILHAQDAYLGALIISEKLNLCGFSTLTFKDISGRATHQEINEARWELLEVTPAMIVLGSPGLFENGSLSEIAQMAKEKKIMIPVTLKPQIGLPAWFLDPLDLFCSRKIEGSRGWNKLVSSLQSKTSPLFWPLSKPHSVN